LNLDIISQKEKKRVHKQERIIEKNKQKIEQVDDATKDYGNE